jgi:acyl-CoA synthetase (NDP forming)
MLVFLNKFSDFLDIPAALSSGRVLKGKRVAILTSTGGAGTLVADSLGEWGFETPVPDEITAARLRALQPGDQAVLDRNPIDVTLAGLQPDLLRGAISALLDSPTYDALILILGSSSLSMPDLMAGAVRDCMQSSDKPVIAYVSPHAPIAGALMTKLGVPAFSQPESCSVALSSMLHANGLQGEIIATGSAAKIPSSLDIASLHGSLNEHQAKNLFSAFGIPGVREVVVEVANPNLELINGLGDKCVVKILSDAIIHKTEVGGVALNVPIAEVRAKLETMAIEVKAKTGSTIEEFLIQEMASGGMEFIVGMHRDPLGTAILVGMGGVTAELFNDTNMRLLSPGKSLSEAEVLEMLQDLKTWPLLNGYRGRPQCDIKALVKAVVQFSVMVAALDDRLVECEINPIFVFPAGHGVKAADGIAVFN